VSLNSVDAVVLSPRFLRSEEDDKELTWEVKLARKYYAKLFKEYCLADLSRYKESKIGERPFKPAAPHGPVPCYRPQNATESIQS